MDLILKLLNRFFKACISSGSQISLIGSIILCASIIIGILSITGLGVKLTSFIISASGNNIWPALLLTGLACLVLGMEVPTTAAYVICVSVAGPALVDMGLELLQVHLFVFWFALLSTITPPVCGTVFIAAGMVSENWLKVSITSMSLGIGLYFIPLAMIANKSIIELNSTFILSILAFVKIATGLTFIILFYYQQTKCYLKIGRIFYKYFYYVYLIIKILNAIRVLNTTIFQYNFCLRTQLSFYQCHSFLVILVNLKNHCYFQ